MYDVSTKTVPHVWETSGSIVVDLSFIVTCTMYRRGQYHFVWETNGPVVVE